MSSGALRWQAWRLRGGPAAGIWQSMCLCQNLHWCVHRRTFSGAPLSRTAALRSTGQESLCHFTNQSLFSILSFARFARTRVSSRSRLPTAHGRLMMQDLCIRLAIIKCAGWLHHACCVMHGAR